MRALARILRTFGHTPASTPTAPTGLSVSNDGDGDAITATVTGTGTIRLLYNVQGASAVTEGSTRSGSGTIALSGLTNNTWYECQAIVEDGECKSNPTPAVGVYVTDTSATEEGPWTLPLVHLRESLATTARFQTWIGATGATAAERIAEAKLKIHMVGFNPTGASDYPFALVVQSGRFRSHSIGGGASHHYIDDGELGIFFVSAITASYMDRGIITDYAAAEFEHTNDVGQIVADLEDLAVANGLLIINSIETDAGAQPIHPDKGIAAYESVWRVGWGLT